MKRSNMFTIVTLSTLTIGLTFCQSLQAIDNEQSVQLFAEASTIPVIEQMEITFGKPILQEELKFDAPILQEEIKFGEPILQNEIRFGESINVLKQTMNLNDQQLEQYNWQLKNAVDNQSKPIIKLTRNSEPVVLKFTRNKVKDVEYKRVGFSVGCNSMSGGYQFKNNQLSVNAIMSTRMYCDKLDAAESMLAKMMEGKSTLSLENGMLSQTTAGGSTLIWQGTLSN